MIGYELPPNLHGSAESHRILKAVRRGFLSIMYSNLRVKWNRRAGYDEDDESHPLCVVLTAPQKNGMH